MNNLGMDRGLKSDNRTIKYALGGLALLGAVNASALTVEELESSPSLMSVGTVMGNTVSLLNEHLVSSASPLADSDTYKDRMELLFQAAAGEYLSTISIDETAFVATGDATSFQFVANGTATTATGTTIPLGAFDWSVGDPLPNYLFASGTLTLAPGVTSVILYLENLVSYSNYDEGPTGAFIRLDDVNFTVTTTPVPVPAAAWLFAPAALLLARRRATQG